MSDRYEEMLSVFDPEFHRAVAALGFDVWIAADCPMCATVTAVPATREQVAAYEAGALVQDAFPHLTADARETIISGLCPTCFDTMTISLN